MGYKNWPTWLKGGFIGLIISLIGVLGLLIGRLLPWFYILSYLNFLNVVIISLLFHKVNMGFEILYWGLLTAPILYFLIGVLIGWIVSKIKSKK